MSFMPQGSVSFRARNPHLFGISGSKVPAEARQASDDAPKFIKVARRCRQSDEELNGGEKEVKAILEGELRMHGVKLRAQSLRFRLGNGVWYKPDFSAMVAGRMRCWEVKGPKKARWSRRGELTIKVAASAWPEVQWWLFWKEDGRWCRQEILS